MQAISLHNTLLAVHETSPLVYHPLPIAKTQALLSQCEALNRLPQAAWQTASLVAPVWFPARPGSQAVHSGAPSSARVAPAWH